MAETAYDPTDPLPSRIDGTGEGSKNLYRIEESTLSDTTVNKLLTDPASSSGTRRGRLHFADQEFIIYEEILAHTNVMSVLNSRGFGMAGRVAATAALVTLAATAAHFLIPGPAPMLVAGVAMLIVVGVLMWVRRKLERAGDGGYQ